VTYVASKKVEDALLDLHKGLHLTMEKLIKQKNYAEAERNIRIVDANMSMLINRLKSI
jgi:hypothetical protein